jgi:hypothetical protein
MLFDPARHEPLTSTAWDAARAHEALATIVRDAEQQHLPGGHWPVHPNDNEGDLPADGAFKSLYLGSAGVWWALWTLQREGAVALRLDPVAGIDQAMAAYAAAPDTGEAVPSYFLGEVGIRLVQWRLTGSAAAADALFAAIEANIPNPTNEALWAAPGTMVAAWHLWQATGEDRWRTLFAANLDQLWRTWLWDEAAQCHLWTQDMYGQVTQYLGAGHGFVGNAYALLLPGDAAAELVARIEAMLQRFAIEDDGAANWPALPGTQKQLMQWCHGAPGVVTALAGLPPGRSALVDRLLLAGGEAVWRAGPIAKGPGVCHGTAGNGYALLKLHRRTGDPLWLQRARAFAMHAIAQCEQRRTALGRGRHTLWTGDLGLALYLWHCIRAGDSLPALDGV